MATKRLQRELATMEKDAPPNCTAKLVDPKNLFHWQGCIVGPPDSPYSAGKFQLDIKFPADYPFKPPTVKFLTKVFHPNVGSSGDLCLDVLKENWSPALTIGKVLLSISSLLMDPNPDSPLSSDSAQLYKHDRRKYDATVREWTQKYAI